MSFNLLDEDWIRVRAADGSVRQVSLLEGFRGARSIRAIAGEIPTQDAAILRLMIAIATAAFADPNRDEYEARELWGRWWADGNFPFDALRDYLERHRDRFDLLDPDRPFYQVGNLTTASGATSGLNKLIADVPDGAQFFTTRAASGVQSLSFAEAARWVVHCQAFDPSGIKTGAVGDGRVKGGKGYPIGKAWVGQIGLVVLEGANLAETLLLNTVAFPSFEGDRPSWERPQLGAGEDLVHPKPVGSVDLFTWQSRRIRLIHDGARVRDVQVSNGDRLPPQNMQPFEPMAAWKFSANQSKGGAHVLMPVLHQPNKAVWQGLAALLVPSATRDAVRPATVEWLAAVIDDGYLAPDTPQRFRAVGVAYGSNDSVIDAVVDDGIDCAVLTIADPQVVQVVIDAGERAKAVAIALANLASNLADAAGGDRAAPRSVAFERAYAAMDEPFRDWVRTVEPSDLATAMASWEGGVFRIARTLGDQLISDAGPAAVIGRPHVPLGKVAAIHFDAALADIWFRAALRKALPLVVSTERVHSMAGVGND